VAAARAGAGLRSLAEICGEIKYRTAPPDPDDKKDPSLDRALFLDTTFDGAGVLRGDLTPECTAMVQAVLDALAAPAGAGDLRTRAQRYHDALEEAMRCSRFCIMISSWTTRRLTGIGPAQGPSRAGRPGKDGGAGGPAVRPGRQLHPGRAGEGERGNCRDHGTIDASAVSQQHRVMAPGYPAATCCGFQPVVPYGCDQ